MTAVRIPTATYRLQFNRRFRFADAARIVPYLDALGISDVYASPIFQASRGSMHGYDVTDHTRLNSDLGISDFRRFTDQLRRFGMGLILDVVPNHMGVGDDSNLWWQDVLENGPSSPFARCFDIDWNPPKLDLAHKVLLPVLGDQFGRALESGDLRLVYIRRGFWIQNSGRRFPVAPRTWTLILEPMLDAIRSKAPAADPGLVELQSILTALRYLPLRTETASEKVLERQREKEVVKRRLAELLRGRPEYRRILRAIIQRINGRPGDPRSFDEFERLLAHQAHRLAYWRVASDEINYRRFFDVNDLAAIRVELPEVFARVHSLVLRLVRGGWVTGLRVDHPDGLYDPRQYFHNLQDACQRARRRGGRGAGDRDEELHFYVIAEKILSGDEKLDPSWAMHGTTGYEFLNCLNGIFVDHDRRQAFVAVYEHFVGGPQRYDDTIYQCKRVILESSMPGELRVLARKLDRISEQHRWSRDFTLPSLQAALREVVACFPVYRTYTRRDTVAVSDEDRRHIETAIHDAKRRNPLVTASIFDFIGSVLLLQDVESFDETQRDARREFVMRFQQFTAPVMAKGIEDTAFYRTFPLASLNEVGGEPQRFGNSVAEFHRRNAERLASWPHSLSTTSTHDSKRSEDVRARLDVLSEIPQDWHAALERWRGWNRPVKALLEGAEVPDANEEYLLYQTLVGTWPLEPAEPGPDVIAGLSDRIVEYMQKALREAKLHTSWVNPDSAYESATRHFVQQVLQDPRGEFMRDLATFVRSIEPAGCLNSIAQTLVKIASPGTPDFYQGTELWDLRLVDPDNRGSVDFARRQRFLAELQERERADRETLLRELLASWRDGGIKMYVIYKGLQLRRSRQELFSRGEYLPLEARGRRKSHVCAFARVARAEGWIINVVPRLTMPLLSRCGWPAGEAFEDDDVLHLPRYAPIDWEDVLAGGVRRANSDDLGTTLSLRELFRSFPAALLVGR